MYQKIALTLMLFFLVNNTVYAANRFSRPLEYELMSGCVGQISYRVDKKEKVRICGKALELTQENGFFPDYDNDDDFNDDAKEFMTELSKNISKCLKEC